MSTPALIDVTAIDPRIRVDLRYATARNFTGRVLYPAARALLLEPAARRLAAAQDVLAAAGYGLLVWDAYRPLSVQRVLWEFRPDPRFVAPPWRGSRHNRGTAVDVTLVAADGTACEMPTDYDDFSPRAHRASTDCSAEAQRNRTRLTAAMEAAGFAGLADEWWHFDAPGWESWPLLDVSLDDA
jgi:D-alanyl-D-alanine dipeptidase